jgi:hypothetical protein
MKTVIQTVIITSSIIFTGINTLDNKALKPAKEEVIPAESPKIYKPILTPVAPFCPSSEYQLATLRQAEGQSGSVHTEHCSKCNMGALYEKNEKKVCTYCESTFSL